MIREFFVPVALSLKRTLAAPVDFLPKLIHLQLVVPQSGENQNFSSYFIPTLLQ
ncbi:hypothetical protein [uncultured Nostoc sp.]|uniref:hypothetical protein n=1 Tax=uncultured Nostoc sp. TaxID=340711 RepID=UPI0035C9B09B